jgi:hypothetical protein
MSQDNVALMREAFEAFSVGGLSLAVAFSRRCCLVPACRVG